MSAGRDRVSVVLAARDVERTVAATVSELSAILRGAGLEAWEVVVVDDGSSDFTAAAAAAAGARVILHPASAGLGRSLKTGMLAAAHDTIVTCDAVSTDSAAAIPGLLSVYREGFDMVVGRRMGFGDGFVETVLRAVVNRLVEYSAGQRVHDVTSGLRILDRRTASAHFRMLPDSFGFAVSLTLAYLLTGRFVAYVPVQCPVRAHRAGVRVVRESLRTLQGIVEALVHYNPLKVFLLPTAAFALVSATGFGLWALRGHPASFAAGWCALSIALLSFYLGLLSVRLRVGRDD